MVLRRHVEILVGKSPTGTDAIRVSDLDVAFKVERTILFEPSTAEIVIYGAKKDTREAISEEGNSVIITAGYEGRSTGIIFSGVVSRASSVHPGPEHVTTIKATNSRAVGKVLDSLSIRFSYKRGTELSVVVTEIAALLGMIPVGLPNIEGIVAAGNLSYVGSVRGALRYVRQILAANQRGFFADNNELVCYRVGEAGEFTATYLDKDTGLLSVKKVVSSEEQADALNARKTKSKVDAKKLRQRVEFSCILLPQVRPNALVELSSSEASGLYLVEKLSYTGDTMGKDWKIDAEATAP